MPHDHRRAREGARGAERRSYDQLDQRIRLVAIWYVAGFTPNEIAAHLSTTPADVDAMLKRLQEYATGGDGRLA
jgi:DNA-binding MarR family transcriptional regulator